MQSFTVYVAINSDGDFEVATRQQEVLDALVDNVGISEGVRVVALTFEAELPGVVEVEMKPAPVQDDARAVD
jgi:hypothetical protein